jgi:peptidoglycan/LPS O-acetylase OafA/YrhL
VAYSLVGASWSLSCEAFFYALFPLAVVAVAAVRRPLLQAGVLASSMVAVAAFTASTTGVGSYFFHLPMVRLSDFLMGMLSCVAMRQGWRPRPGVGGLVGMLGAAYAILWWLQHETLTGTDRQWLFSAILAAPFAVLICACAARDLDGRPVALASRAWVRMGRWSFALYLVHGPVLSILRDPLLVASGWDAGLTIASVIVVSVAAAVVLHETIEAPMERWIRRAWLRRGTLGVETSPSTAVS